MTRRAQLAAAAGVLLLASPAAAEVCGKPDLLDMIPPKDAADVPRNATLSAHYERSAEYLNEQVVVITPDGTEQALPATFDATEGRLSVTPPDLLPPGKMTVRWPVLRALGSATPGEGGEATFTVGTRVDAEAPTFDGVLSTSWDYARETDGCTDETTKRYVFDLTIGLAADDGGRNGLTLILFQTSGPGAMGASVPVHARALPASAATPIRVSLVPEDATGHVCFAGLVRDTTGQISNSADREACVDTVAPPFFRGCELAPQGDARSGAVWGAGLLATLVMLASCRRRPTRTRARVGQ